ncbi:ParB/RepB/Spo0J family partition protein [Palleronia caenipelagi]|uniref:Chromosome partitioning protein ParB n=1 Tax=Palleronia caenipelagi TaxID=2489174 RepID=A0A547PNE8_9RHOB|nr:ParB/RepB/Spo0J family partition protein [Palleronia caenipelagi]TRD15667.1 chromosome partitioning protein ParB [Palleronia caenipelagi]
MAKRRKITAPSAEDLSRIEEEFRGETSNRAAGAMAPIAQVAREAADAAEPLPAGLRAEQARDKADATRLREAEAGGLLLLDLPTDAVDADVMVRDRTMLDHEELEELKRSILVHGMRLPIEVFDKGETAGQGGRFGLISGYRRLRAVRELHSQYSTPETATIRAILRDPEQLGGAMVAMVEENEIRSQLSHFERGRIAVVAAERGVYATVEEAVNNLFTTASKAKRSKIRSFALICEDLGDLLSYAEALKERDGLRLAAALRNGADRALRDALEAQPVHSAAEEWSRLESVVERYEADVKPAHARGGRPRKTPQVGWTGPDELRLSNGITIRHAQDGNDHMLRLSGRIDSELVASAMQELARLLDRPK